MSRSGRACDLVHEHGSCNTAPPAAFDCVAQRDVVGNHDDFDGYTFSARKLCCQPEVEAGAA